MKKSELKKIIKPLVKECINEVILESGILSNIISEVVRGLKPMLMEAASTNSLVIEDDFSSSNWSAESEPNYEELYKLQELAEKQRKLRTTQADAQGKAVYAKRKEAQQKQRLRENVRVNGVNPFDDIDYQEGEPEQAREDGECDDSGLNTLQEMFGGRWKAHLDSHAAIARVAAPSAGTSSDPYVTGVRQGGRVAQTSQQIKNHIEKKIESYDAGW